MGLHGRAALKGALDVHRLPRGSAPRAEHSRKDAKSASMNTSMNASMFFIHLDEQRDERLDVSELTSMNSSTSRIRARSRLDLSHEMAAYALPSECPVRAGRCRPLSCTSPAVGARVTNVGRRHYVALSVLVAAGAGVRGVGSGRRPIDGTLGPIGSLDHYPRWVRATTLCRCRSSGAGELHSESCVRGQGWDLASN